MGFARWFRLSIGLLLALVPLWALFTRLDAIWNGHPAYPTTLLVTVAVGLILVASALLPRRGEPEPDGSAPWEQDAPTGGGPLERKTRRRGWRIAARIVGAVLAVLLVGFLGWLRPFTAGPDALAALHSDSAVTVMDHPTTIDFLPAKPLSPKVGLVFSPGARVDSRAYAALLRPLAEAATR